MHVDECDMQIDEDIHMTFDHMMMKIFYNYLTKNPHLRLAKSPGTERFVPGVFFICSW